MMLAASQSTRRWIASSTARFGSTNGLVTFWVTTREPVISCMVSPSVKMARGGRTNDCRGHCPVLPASPAIIAHQSTHAPLPTHDRLALWSRRVGPARGLGPSFHRLHLPQSRILRNETTIGYLQAGRVAKTGRLIII